MQHNSKIFETKKDLVFLTLAGFFITNALLAEIIGGKLIQIPARIPFTDIYPIASLGVILWPVVFVSTDLINEYFGKDGVRRLTLLTTTLILFAFAVLLIAIKIPAVSFSPVHDDAFASVFGQSLWIILGSVVAFLCSQLVDVWTFWFFRHRTGAKMLWLRATGSTAISQVIDTFVVLGIAFWLPGKVTTAEYLSLTATNYVYKLAIALAMTPIIYLAHATIDRYIGWSEAQNLTETVSTQN